METVLISPATRVEIVLGKYLTVMLASVTTAVLNLVSMGLTGVHWPSDVGPVPPSPPSPPCRDDRSTHHCRPRSGSSSSDTAGGILQRDLCALAVLARSMKEGQYYMTPLY